MDILAHGVYSVALNKTIIVKKKTRKEILESFFWGVMPDLFAFGPSFVIALFRGSNNHHALLGQFDSAARVYPFTHSLVVFGFVFLIAFLVTKKWHIPMLGWGLHVLLDIPFHTPAFYPTPFLFPISTYVFPYGIEWGIPWVWVSLWLIALIWFAWAFIKTNDKQLSKM